MAQDAHDDVVDIDDVADTDDAASDSSSDTEGAGGGKQKVVPYDRFSQVVKERNGLRQKLNEKDPPAPKEEPKEKPADALSRQEAIAYAKGLTEPEVERASKIAAVEGITLLEAIEHDLFKDWKAKQDAEKKSKDAALGASRGSGRQPAKKSFNTPGLSAEEHKKMWKESQA